MPPLFFAMFTAIRGASALWGQTEVQVNLNLGLTSRSPILDVFYEVYNELGFGFLESVYEKAMVIALGAAGLWVSR
ncbi:MAG: GxxExxY protein [Isosphaeraceae bacterium]